jgi:hypothetical protein
MTSMNVRIRSWKSHCVIIFKSFKILHCELLHFENFNRFLIITRLIAIEKISNKLLYEITSNLSLNISSFKRASDNHTQLRKKAENFINWAQMINKLHYDHRHLSLFLKVKKWALLRLHHEYSISEFKNMIKKMSTQYVRSFKVIQRVKRLTYRLVISEDWKIHSVFSIAQLESISDSTQDFYNRSRSNHCSFVIDNQNSYEIERLLNKRTIRRKTEYFTKYLVRWLDYEFEFDRWYNVKNLENVTELITNYDKKLFNSFNWLIITRLLSIIITTSFSSYHSTKSSWSFQNEINWTRKYEQLLRSNSFT